MRPPILQVRDLTVSFAAGAARSPAVDAISFDVGSGELLGIVGESGSGKSVTALAILKLLPPTALVSGGILFDGRDIAAMTGRELRATRGHDVAMIFQEPMTSLNPVFTIGDQIAEAVLAHERVSRRAAKDRAAELLTKVGIASARRRMNDYPHQLSGGMRQRVMIAIALACSPKLLIADEPTTALDVTIQAQLLDLLNGLRAEFGTAIVFITHNMGVMAEVADRVIVMYAGAIVEEAGVFDLFDDPRHPYTEGLLRSTPRIGPSAQRLTTIPGAMPAPESRPAGCLFTERCYKPIDACAARRPPFVTWPQGRRSACIRAVEPHVQGAV